MEEQGGEEEAVVLDEGEMFAIRRALNVQKQTEEEQRDNIFYNRCTI